MKTIKMSAVLAVAMLAVVASSARAQETVVVKVPFPFVVRGQEMPAGHYDIRSDAGILSIRGTDNSAGTFALALPADGRDPAGDQPSLVFVRREHQNLLSQIWESDTDGLALFRSSMTSKRGHADLPPQSSIVLTSGVEVSGK